MTSGAVRRPIFSRVVRFFLFLAITLLAAAAISVIVEWRLRPAFGATGQYFDRPDWTGSVRVRAVDPDLTTRRLVENWRWRPQPFSVRWEAWLLLSRAGTYRFASASDDGSTLWVDETIVVDNGGLHEGRMVVGSRELSAGVHRLRVDYFEGGGGSEIDVRWAEPGAALRTLAAPDLLASPPSAAARRWWPFARTVRDRLTIAVTIAYLAAFVALTIGGPLRAMVRRERVGRLPADVRAVLVITLLLAAVALWWGLPGPGWASDELTPDDFATALDAHFANGWWSKYPPGHFQFVIAASAPVWMLRAIDPSAYGDRWGELAIFLIARSISVVMSMGVTLLVYLCGRRLFDHTTAIVGAALFALLPPFVYYGKLANLDMPYLFWFAVALLAYARLYDAPTTADLMIYAAAGTAAICTKDQAYGLFVLPSFAVMWRVLRLHSREMSGALAAATAVAAVLFVASHNLVFNVTGFVEHLRSITGSQSQSFRVFERGPAGQWAMFAVSIRLLVVMLGVPACTFAVIGVVSAAKDAAKDRGPGRLFWFGLPALSYYLTFIAVVGYTYDRFLLPIALTLSLFAGAGVAALVRIRAMRALTIAVASAAAVLVLYRAIALDLAMLRDSRYQVEKWMAQHAPPGETVVAIGLTEFLPRLDEYRVERFLALDAGDLETLRAPHVIANDEFARRYAPGSEEYAAYERLTAGQGPYRPAAMLRASLPFEMLTYQHAVHGVEAFTNLAKINPAMRVLAPTAP
jgi:hypothetical protein